MKLLSMTIVAGLAAGSALADGDAAAGKDAFRQCQSCHIVADASGKVLAGRTAKTGPNLYGLPGSQAGTVEGYRYGKSLVEAGEKGLVWDEDTFVAYVTDPTGYLREVLGNPRARGKMTFKVRKEEDAHNLYAYLASLSSEN